MPYFLWNAANTYLHYWTKHANATNPGIIRIYHDYSGTKPFANPSVYFPCLQVRSPQADLADNFYANMAANPAANTSQQSGTLHFPIYLQGMTTGTFHFGVMIHTDQTDYSNQTGTGYALYGTVGGGVNEFRISKCDSGFASSTGTNISGNVVASSEANLVIRNSWMGCLLRWELTSNGLYMAMSTGGLSTPSLTESAVYTDEEVEYPDNIGINFVFANKNAEGCFFLGPVSWDSWI